MDRSSKWDLAFGLFALGLAIDKIFIRPRDLPFDYLWALVAVVSFAKFGWAKWKG